jgi:haloalkane dehalogenase
MNLLQNKPAVFIWGMKDPVIKPSYLEKFRTAFTKNQVVPLDGCGHFPQEEEPQMVSAAMQEFMKSVKY